MLQKVLSALAIVAGGLGSIFQLLVAFGANITPDQHTAIAAVFSLLLLVLGVFINPTVNAKLTKK